MLVKKDIPKRLANDQVRAALGPRAYVSKRPGSAGATLWLDNRDRALCGDHEGPLLAAKGEDYRELVRLAQARAILESAEEALRGRPAISGRIVWQGHAPSQDSFVVRIVALTGSHEAVEVLLPSGGGWDLAAPWLAEAAYAARKEDPVGRPIT